jgi:dipeptidyl aminopeptidase/acylaminoacyl peptidase
MSEYRNTLEHELERLSPPRIPFDQLVRRRDRRRRDQRIRAGVLGAAIAIGVGWLSVNAIRSAPSVPADDRSDEFGIFAPIAGRIVYVNGTELGYETDLGYAGGLWGVDPDASRDTVEGPSVADEVPSALVRLGPGDMIPLGWSSDGTELLFKRTSEDPFPQEYLYILHVDGSETRLNSDPMYFGGATIAPDGSRVVFAAQADHLGLYVVDSGGGRAARLPLPGAEGIVMAPTFSPDGTQIAYLDTGERENHVWVMDADGSNAHELLANEETLVGGVSGLQWSPAGDRIAIQVRSTLSGDNAIYTFAPDGSDFTQVITAATSPYWSPDGSQIAYTIVCDERPDGCGSGRDRGYLGVVDADGSNVREFGFASSGPWHPGA